MNLALVDNGNAFPKGCFTDISVVSKIFANDSICITSGPFCVLLYVHFLYHISGHINCQDQKRKKTCVGPERSAKPPASRFVGLDGGAPGPAAPAESEQAEAPAAQTAGIVRGKVTDSNSNMLVAIYAAAAKNRAGRQKE